jgi:hypothetical protein
MSLRAKRSNLSDRKHVTIGTDFPDCGWHWKPLEGESTAMAATREDAINDALERLQKLGFTMENSFSEYGPMVAEAISTLGCNDDVAGWVEKYKRQHRHAPLPPPKRPIDGSNEAEWRSALGD